MFDSVSKFQIEQYPADFATWLLGEPIALTKLEPTELSIRIDELSRTQQSNLIAVTSVLAGLQLDRAVIALGEDLLDFTNIGDLQAWFNAR